MFKIGLSTTGFLLTDENFKALRASGIQAVEISMKADRYPDINYQEVRELADRHGIELWSYHLPFGPFSVIDPSSLDAGVRAHTLDYFKALIERASEIGINKFVVHASGEPIPPEDRAARMQYSKATLNELAEFAHAHGAVIAVEDLPRTCLGNSSADILELLSANDKLRVCFDTNHLLEEDNLHFLQAVGDKVITLHVSDYDFLNERHWLPGEGKQDWKALYRAIKEIGYQGPWMYEIGLDCPKTILRDRPLTFDDFVQNANAIFTENTPPLLGTPVEGLVSWK